MANNKILGIILMILSILVVPIAFSIGAIVGEVDIFGLAGMSYMWLSFFFVPVPLACLIFGLLNHIKKTPHTKKNIISGAIVSAILVLIGISGLNIKVDKKKDFVEEVGNTMSILFPLDSRIMTMSHDGVIESNIKILNFNQEETFANSTKQEPWVKSLPAASKGLLPLSIINKIDGFDTFCLYIKTNDTYNPTKVDAGDYSLILAAYHIKNHHISIFDLNSSV